MYAPPACFFERRGRTGNWIGRKAGKIWRGLGREKIKIYQKILTRADWSPVGLPFLRRRGGVYKGGTGRRGRKGIEIGM